MLPCMHQQLANLWAAGAPAGWQVDKRSRSAFQGVSEVAALHNADMTHGAICRCNHNLPTAPVDQQLLRQGLSHLFVADWFDPYSHTAAVSPRADTPNIRMALNTAHLAPR